MSITLCPLTTDDREQFILDNQEAFNYGALVEFGERNTQFEEEGQNISRRVIEKSLDAGVAYRILADGRVVGGVVLKIEGTRGELELLFTTPVEHSKGYGQAAWKCVEELYPAVTVWQTFTPYFEARNVHFYVNRLGFSIVEFFNEQHPLHREMDGEPVGENMPDGENEPGSEVHEDFLFIKEMVPSSAENRETLTLAYEDKESLHSYINEQVYLATALKREEQDGEARLMLVLACAL